MTCKMTNVMRAMVVGAVLTVFPSTGWCWPMPWAWGPDGQGGSFFAEQVFNISGNKTFSENGKVRVQLLECSVPANILWPGDKPTFSFQVENLMAEPISFKGKVEVIQYALRTPGEDFFKVNFVKLADCGSVPFAMEIPAKGFKNFTMAALPIPETFGGYGLVVDCGQYGRLMGATTARVIKPSQATNPKPFPRVMMDGHYIDVLSRLGAVSNRIGTSMRPPSDPSFAKWHKDFGDQLKAFHAAHITTTVEFGGGPDSTHPLGKRGGEFKTLEGERLNGDNAWLPKFDKDFQEQVRLIVAEYGWPKGPVVGVKLYNEPWEGGGIDGWSADSVRYREMYAAMAQGVEQARKEAGVEVLIGGVDSTSNTFDKLFAKGPADDFLKWLDFHSMHYQGMAIPAGYKPWRNRKDADGKPAPVRMWDTESWVANSDERVAAVLAAYCSVGYERVVGIFADGFIQGVENIKIRTETGTENRFIKRPWSPAAAIAGFSYMIGDRPFKELLFKNGLPWVMVFEGNPTPTDKTNLEDGTVVVVGDLGPTFNADTLPFRTVKRQNAKMIITADGDAFGLYDSYANPVKTQRGTITLPLDGTGYYLRGNGKPGSFKKLLAAIESSRIEGIEPVEIKAHDLLAPVTQKPSLRLSITNVLNRPVRGTLSTTLGSLTLKNAKQTLSFKAHETQEVLIPVTAGAPINDNSYALKATFDANADGRVALNEVMHANVIARMTPTIDGKLDDWNSALPQPVMVDGVVKPTTEERAWRPWEKFESKTVKGFAVGYLAYDDQHFYYAAKIADTTPHEGMHRMENSNDDEWFYPATVMDKAGKTINWPEGVRRFTYAKAPELPAGNFSHRDNVQIGFNVLTDAEKDWLPYMAGTRRDYGSVPTNDYEYALNPIAEKYGGGTEIWRIQVPGMGDKNFYPHQPKGPLDGAVKLGKLAIKRDANTRYVEAAIPWAEIPHVRRALDGGNTIKFSFRINDNAGIGCMELAKNRGVAKRGSSFSVNWIEHWTNEVEFAFQK